MKKWYALIIAAVIAIDRFVKLWAQKALPTREGWTLPVWEDVFHLTYVENRGAAFGMLQNQRVFFVIITLLIVLVLIWLLFIKKEQKFLTGAALSLIMGGALGNFYDRLVYGFVVDMFDFRLINFAVFNVADSALCIGVALIALLIILEDVEANKEKKQALAEDREEVQNETDN